ncbi:hypothetical protein ACET3Z_013741 [Daucus carota]
MFKSLEAPSLSLKMMLTVIKRAGPYANSSSPRKGEGSSGKSSLACLQDDLFLRIMDETLTRARAHPEEYTLTPEAIQFLTSNVIE